MSVVVCVYACLTYLKRVLEANCVANPNKQILELLKLRSCLLGLVDLVHVLKFGKVIVIVIWRAKVL